MFRGSYFRKFLKLCFIMSVLLSPAILAQGTGSLKGKVLDKATNEALGGANIIIQGTTLGAAADLDGNFVIRNIPAGNHKIIVSYIGYNSDSTEINLVANRTIEQEFYLSLNVVEGQTVVVTSQAQGQMSAIQQQLTSDKISSIVSEAKIQELPDFNAAASIGRLPGVSTLESSGEANKVVIRGLAPKYNQITIGGVSLASTGSDQIGITSLGGAYNNINNDRSVDLTMISPYMLKNIAVYKSLTPDLNADAIGGVVNMDLREAPSGLHTDLLWQSGYTAKTKQYGNYRANASISNRFFNNQFGVYVLGNIESYDRNADNMNTSYFTALSTVDSSTGYRPVRVGTVNLVRHVETRKRYGANLVLDYKLPNGSIQLVNMASRIGSDKQDYTTSLNYQNNDLQFNYSGGKNNTDAMLNSLNLKNDFRFMQLEFTAANTYSRNNLPESPRFQFTQTRGVGTSTVNTIPEDLTYLVGYSGASNVYLNTVSLYSSDYKENNQDYKTNLKFPLNVGGDFNGYFKVGGEFSYRQHTNQQNTPYANIDSHDSIQTRLVNTILANHPELNNSYDKGLGRFFSSGLGSLYSDNFLDNRFGPLLWTSHSELLTDIVHLLAADPRLSGTYNSTSQNPGGWFDGIFQTTANTYKYIERYYAAYAMSELNYSDLMVVGGVRYEKEKGLYEAFNLLDGRNPATDKAFLVNAYPQNEYWLPMVQARYRLTDWFDIRSSYTQTLARPDYHQLSPHFSIAYGGGSVAAGNPSLKPAQAYNYDLALTFHNNELGLFSITGFYKEINSFTYPTHYPLYPTAPAGFDSLGLYNIGGHTPNSGAPLYTYVNSPYTAYIRGIEIDLQTRFWYLPIPFNGIVFSINYTHINSKATYPFLFTKTTYRPRPLPSITEVVDSSRAGRLLYQPNDVMNATLGYEIGGFSARLSFLFQGNAVSYIGNYPEEDGFTRNFFRMDASVRQILPWEGFEVYLDMNNLNSRNNQSAQQTIDGFTNEQNYGMTASLGLRYRL